MPLDLPPDFDVSRLTVDEQIELLKLLSEKDVAERRNWLGNYKPYPKQALFHAKGYDFTERLFMASNQSGKTMAGAAEMAMHATGRYPDWWKGRRFPHAIRALAGSESAELTKKGIQRLLVGPPEIPEQWGTGAIPYDLLHDTNSKPGVPDALASVVVKHEPTGEHSVIQFPSYDQGRTKWQADTVHVVWPDEEPPLDVYSEALTRIAATDGIVFVTFTPLLGMSSVVKRFLLEKPDGTTVVQMSLEDALHYTPEQRAKVEARWPEHEREARARGEPMLGEGRVFTVAESAVKVRPFPIPAHWPRIVGVDIGFDHPTAFAWMAWDRDTDTLYVYDVYREKGGNVPLHSISLRAKGAWIPAAWPHDGLQHDKGSGIQIAQQYRDAGCNMLRDKATFPDGSNGFEAGVGEMNTRFQQGQLKVFDHLEPFFEEFRIYHRKNGQVVKLNDDILSACRYGMMMRRFALTPAEAGGRNAPIVVAPWGTMDSETGY